jgi:hypothetical protein
MLHLVLCYHPALHCTAAVPFLSKPNSASQPTAPYIGSTIEVPPLNMSSAIYSSWAPLGGTASGAASSAATSSAMAESARGVYGGTGLTRTVGSDQPARFHELLAQLLAASSIADVTTTLDALRSSMVAWIQRCVEPVSTTTPSCFGNSRLRCQQFLCAVSTSVHSGDSTPDSVTAAYGQLIATSSNLREVSPQLWPPTTAKQFGALLAAVKSAGTASV